MKKGTSIFTSAERKLLNEIEFEDKIGALAKIAFKGELRRLRTYDKIGRGKNATGLSVQVNRTQPGLERVFEGLQQKLAKYGYRVFGSEYVEPKSSIYFEAAIVRTTDSLDIVRLRRTSALNYGLSHEDVLSKLLQWNRAYSFAVHGAGRDWIAMQFEELPSNLIGLAEDVYWFCPDTVDQGSVALAPKDKTRLPKQAMAKFPKLSPQTEKKLARSRSSRLPPGFVSDQFASTAMGIRLLALSIMKTKDLTLWWD